MGHGNSALPQEQMGRKGQKLSSSIYHGPTNGINGGGTVITRSDKTIHKTTEKSVRQREGPFRKFRETRWGCCIPLGSELGSKRG